MKEHFKSKAKQVLNSTLTVKSPHVLVPLAVVARMCTVERLIRVEEATEGCQEQA